MGPVFTLLICLLIGFAISAAVTSGMLAELRSVKKKDNAVYYIEPESFNLTYSNETFIKTDVNKIAKNVNRDGDNGAGYNANSGARGRGYGADSGGAHGPANRTGGGPRPR